jgi:hypothetical protein
MLQETILENSWIHARVTVLNASPYPLTSNSQDLATIYAHPTYSQLVYYTGSQPFTNASLTIISAPTTVTYFTSSENWAALLNPDTGLAIGVFTLTTTSYVVLRTVSNPSSTSDNTFLTPRVSKGFAINEQFQFDYYLKVGKIEDIRSAFYQIPRS